MVKAARKPLEELFGMVKSCKRVLVVGCGGCTSVCLAGGQREAIALADDLTACARQALIPHHYTSVTVERQCNPEFLEGIDDLVHNADGLLSMACGAGAGYLADTYPSVPVFPALDTLFVGVDLGVGLYEQRCQACGVCHLAYTGGICPCTRCAKSLLNGPCGGTREDGSCELGEGRACAWQKIYERLKAQGRLSSIMTIEPAEEWEDRSPQTLVQRGYEGRYEKKAGEGT